MTLKKFERKKQIQWAVVLSALCFALFCWSYLLWIHYSQISPPQKFEFTNGQSTYPTCLSPTLIEKDQIWQWCTYDEATNQGGLTLFNFSTGKAEMNWPFPEGIKNTSLIGALKNTVDDVYILHTQSEQQADRKKQTAFIVRKLAFNGGAKQAAPPLEKLQEPEFLGWDFRNGMIEVVFSEKIGQRQRISAYRLDGAEWLQSTIQELPANTWIINNAFLHQGQWNLLYYQPSKAKYRRTVEVDIIHYKEKLQVPISLMKIELPRDRQDHNWFDPSVGNKLGGTNPLYRWSNGKLQPTTTKAISQNTSTKRFLLERPLTRILIWEGPSGPINEMEEQSFETFVQPATAGGRPFLFLRTQNLPKSLPLVDPYEFQNVPIIARGDAGWWVMGTHGHYIQIDRKLVRSDSISFLKRMEILNTKAKNPQTDFFKQDSWIKQYILKIYLYTLPVFWILGWFTPRSTYSIKTINKIRNRLFTPSILYLALCIPLLIWFIQLAAYF